MSKSIPKSSREFLVGNCSATWLGAVLVGFLSASCSDDVVVGDAKDLPGECEDCDAADASELVDAAEPADSSVAPAAEPADASVPEGPDCTVADAEARSAYDTWRSTPNSLAELAGAVFSGYIEGGSDLTLGIGRDQSATLVVGERAAPPVKDAAYLCGEEDPLDVCSLRYESGLLEGGTYPLHGASFEDGRLLVEVQQAAAADPWCALQDPVLAEPDCYYSLVGPDEIGWGPNSCTVGNALVDCGWFAMAALDMQPCACTSTECFGGIDRLEKFTFDLRLMADDGRLEGSLVLREDARDVLLFPSAD
jgi:hypothetical protein